MINTNPPAPAAKSGIVAVSSLHVAARSHPGAKARPASPGQNVVMARSMGPAGTALRPAAFSTAPTAWPDSVLDVSTRSSARTLDVSTRSSARTFDVSTCSSANTPVEETSAPEYLPRVDVLENIRDNNLRVDLDALLPYGFTPSGFFRAGIFDIGNANLANLEYGMMLDQAQGTAFRFGLYKSKLSVGADYGLAKQISLNADLYGLNGVNADVHGVYMLNSNFGVVVGVDNVLRNAGPVIGIEYRR